MKNKLKTLPRTYTKLQVNALALIYISKFLLDISHTLWGIIIAVSFIMTVVSFNEHVLRYFNSKYMCSKLSHDTANDIILKSFDKSQEGVRVSVSYWACCHKSILWGHSRFMTFFQCSSFQLFAHNPFNIKNVYII